MSRTLDVECVHLEGELLRVRFADSQLVSDHPPAWGGHDTGPAPGTMILMALTAASALAGRRYATLHSLDAPLIAARASLTTVREGFPEAYGPVALPHLIYTERFWRLFEVDGRLTEQEQADLAQAMGDNRVSRTVREGMAIDERVIFHPATGPRRAPPEIDHPLKGRPRLAPGQPVVVSEPDHWRVTAQALDEQTCLIKAGPSLSAAGDEAGAGRGPSPEELLLAGLASCTGVFLARNAAFHGIPTGAIRVRVRAELPDDPAAAIPRVEKIAEITGELTAEERGKLEDFARYCAFGVTLGRGAPISDAVRHSETAAAAPAPPALQAFGRIAPAPTDPAFCDDGSCCLPAAPEPQPAA
jgi:uncharacterized OsmC-like protein